MPSVGGGSSGGGFHGGGSSGGGFNSNHNGNHGIFIYGHHYANDHAPMSQLIFTPIIILIISAVFFGIFGYQNSKTFRYEEDVFRNYALDQYYDIYGTNSEDEIVFVFLSTQNPTVDGYYQISMVGDNIKYNVSDMFGDNTTVFGKALDSGLPKDYNYSLLNAFRKALDVTATKIEELNSIFYTEPKTVDTPKIVNNVDYNNLDTASLKTALEEFASRTKISLSIVITDASLVFKKGGNVMMLIIGIVLVIMAIFSCYPIIRRIKKNNQSNSDSLRNEPTKLGEENVYTSKDDSSINQNNYSSYNTYTSDDFKDNRFDSNGNKIDNSKE